MADPFVKVKDTNELITDLVWGYTYWRMPQGKVLLTPISGGAYPQNTSAGTLRFGMTLGFRKDHPTSPLDNYFRLFELEREDAQTVYRIRDLQGFTRDAFIVGSPFGDDSGSGASGGSVRDDRLWIEDMISIDVDFVVPGYLPVELGP